MDGQSALLELAISGNFISNDTIVIQPMNGSLAPAGKIVLADLFGGMGKKKNGWQKEVSNFQRNKPACFLGIILPSYVRIIRCCFHGKSR